MIDADIELLKQGGSIANYATNNAVPEIRSGTWYLTGSAKVTRDDTYLATPTRLAKRSCLFMSFGEIGGWHATASKSAYYLIS
jgi:hypothetical protein